MGSLQAPPPPVLGVASHPLRWRLLTKLALSDQRVQELSEAVGRPQNLVSYHLRHLRGAGLVSARAGSADRRDSYHRIHFDRYVELLASAGPALHPGLNLVLESTTPVRMVRRPLRVLFLCTGNSSRSQMAEAMLQATSSPVATAYSAGSHPKPVHPDTIRVMRERGFDLTGRRSKHLSEFYDDDFNLVVTLCDRVREICPEFPGHPTHVRWSIADPAEGQDSAGASYVAFQLTAAEIAERVEFLVLRIAHLAREMEVT